DLLPAAIKLAEDIANAPADKVQAYKRLIDEGFAMNLGDGRKLETATSSKLNAQVSSAAVEQARIGVMARGREQQ
ncbi:MAG TPA: enoyl-CoA hydratase, partial [Verrucomicrobiae bacterium]|nr:enoyl-CoA hydratase [Verrucomicrobiae bacterium]